MDAVCAESMHAYPLSGISFMIVNQDSKYMGAHFPALPIHCRGYCCLLQCCRAYHMLHPP